MLSTRERLVGLYILYEIYLNEKVKTTPFYQLVLDLLESRETLHPAERRLLTDFLKSVPRIAKQTPIEYIQETEKAPADPSQPDLEPYRKAHVANMPKTSLLQGASTISILRDQDDYRPAHDPRLYGPGSD